MALQNVIAVDNGKIVGGGSAGGGGNVRMTLLWENSDPTSAFAAQNIKLSNDDYDILFVFGSANNSSWSFCNQTLKGKPTILNSSNSSGSGVEVVRRTMSFGNDNVTLSFGDGYNAHGSSSLILDNTVCIPYRIYGIKLL